MVGHGWPPPHTMISDMTKTSWTEQKRHQKRQKRRRVALFCGMAALIFGFAYLFIWQRVRTLELADQHAAVKNSVRLLKEKCQSLQYEVEFLASLENVERVARRDLGLLTLQEAQLVKFTLPKPAPTKVDSVKSPTEKKPTPLKKVNRRGA